MKKYEILEHPGEMRLRVYGKTPEELFENAALAMAQTLKHNANTAKINANDAKREKINVESIDLNSLLVDFLSEILAKSQINKCVYYVSPKQIKIATGQASLETEIIGFSVERFDEDIKAITYEDLDIKKIDDIWQTDLVFDV